MFLVGLPLFRRTRVTSLSFVNSAVSNASTVTVPATAQAGDLAVLFDYAHNGGSGVPADVTPSGYTQVHTVTQDGTSNDTRLVVSCRVLGAGEAGVAITGQNQTNNHKVMFVFRPDRPITSVVAGSWAGEAGGGNPASLSVAASGQLAPLVVLGCGGCEASTATFSTASPAFDAEVVTADNDLRAGYKIYNSSPADHAIDINDLGDANVLGAGYLRVA